MNIHIIKLKLQNFKKFKNFEIEFNNRFNVLIGDNESGKSTVLEAINLCLSGSSFKVDSSDITSFFNNEVIDKFLSSKRNYEDLPIVSIEIVTNDFQKYEFEGKKNSFKENLYGVKMLIIPNDEYSDEIKSILNNENAHFPSEYYKVEFRTFADNSFNTYNKKIKHYLIDNTTINTEASIKDFTINIYQSEADVRVRQDHLSKFKKIKQDFDKDVLDKFSESKDYKFKLNQSQKYQLESNLSIYDSGVSLLNKGKGRQTMIKTALAVEKRANNTDILLIEEPENHLSSNNMHKMIDNILESINNQVIITTHSNLILSRLDLQNAFFLGNDHYIPFSSLDKDTTNFFNRQTNSNLLQFVLSNKVILVEGPTEYILMEYFYKKINNVKSYNDGVSIISVNGLSFLRYLEIASKLNIKTAVITDNDGNYDKNINEKYKEILKSNIVVFSDKDNVNRTFEISLYNDNKDIINESKITTSPDKLSFMLNNKSEWSVRMLQLLEGGEIEIKIPNYIKDALEWIKK